MEAGQALLHYRLVETIGEGGMGVVWRARDASLERDVAIKLLPADVPQDADRLRRFEREARLLASLNHPHVATIHGLHEADGVHFLAMELIEGRTLREAMRSPLAVDEVLELALHVTRALAAAHAAGIVHRDVKPENVMLRDDGYAKVLDFGLAQLEPRSVHDPEASTVLTAEGAILGTVPYMSPEQCRGAAVDGASDVFSLGVVLYEMLTGRHPFRSDSLADCMQRILSEAPLSPSRLNPALSGELEALILEAMDKEARRRPDAAEIGRRLSQRLGRGAVRRSQPELGDAQPFLVGRDPQGRKLEEALRAAEGGKAQLVCVSGEPGIGKTTLVEGFLRRLAAEGEDAFAARGRCSERLAGTEAYLPLLEALEDLLRGPRGEQATRVMEQVAPSWYFRVVPLSSGDQGRATAIDDVRASSQERLKRELIAFLQELSRSAPVLLFFDDLHWADASTVDALAYIGARPDGLRLLAIATYRPSDLLLGNHPFVGVKRDLVTRGVATEVALGFLEEGHVAAYLDHEHPGHAFPPELAEFVHARTEGNALFMVNLIRYLRETGAIHEDPEWRLAKPLAALGEDLPESIRSLIERKIEQLAPEDRRLLVTASVQGETFHASIVAEALGEDEADVEERLDRLDRVHALVRVLGEEELPDGSLTIGCAFVHALYQNALHASLTPARRAAQSSAVAAAWVHRRAGDTPPVANELGILFESAREFEQACRFFLEAADKASRIHANQEAIELTQRALANAERLQGGERDRLRLQATQHLAIIHVNISRFVDALEFFRQAEETAEQLGESEARVQAICGRAMAACFLHLLPEMRELADRAREVARSVGSPVGLAHAEVVLAAERLCHGDLHEAQLLYDRSLPVLESAGQLAQAVSAIIFQAGLHTWRLDHETAQRITRSAAVKARELGSTFDIIGSQFFLGMSLGNEGHLGEALATIREANRLAEINQSPYWLARLPNTLAWLHHELGDRETALTLNLENVELAREFDMNEGEANAHVNLATNYMGLSDWDRAREHLRHAERLHETDVWFRWRYHLRLRAAQAQLFIEGGELGAARKMAEKGRLAALEHQSPKYVAQCCSLLGQISTLEGDMAAASAHFDEALAVLGSTSCPTIEWRILRSRAEMAVRQGDSEARDLARARAREVVQRLARSVPEPALRDRFLNSRSVREL